MSLIPKGCIPVTMCLQYSIWLKFNKLRYWQINYLFQCCCQCQKERFEQRNGIDTLKRLSLIIHNSQKCMHRLIFSSDGIRVLKKNQRSQPKSSGLIFMKRRKTKKVNAGCHAVSWKGHFRKLTRALLLSCCVTLGKPLNLPGLVSFFSKWGEEDFAYLKLRVLSG